MFLSLVKYLSVGFPKWKTNRLAEVYSKLLLNSVYLELF